MRVCVRQSEREETRTPAKWKCTDFRSSEATAEASEKKNLIILLFSLHMRSAENAVKDAIFITISTRCGVEDIRCHVIVN